MKFIGRPAIVIQVLPFATSAADNTLLTIKIDFKKGIRP